MEYAVLVRRAFQGLVKLLIVMAAILFLSAWSLRYWQGWLFLLVFSSAVTQITVFFLKKDPGLVERRLKAGAAAEKEPAQKIIQAGASFFFLALIAFPGFDHRFGWSHASFAVVLAGDALVALGLWIVFLVFHENRFTSATIEVSHEQQVVSTGPYRFVRHPMYSGALLMLVGVPLALGSLWGLLLFLPVLAVIVLRLINEERFLDAKLPGYREYRAATRYRLIPGIY
jgi:protein-S-isoprenylcysteine O-methyltransferase Ste14